MTTPARSSNKKLFLSAVSCELEPYRRLLAGDLERPALDVAEQERFLVSGGSTLEKLDDYLLACDGVIHLIGKATGATPESLAVQALLARHPDLAAKLPALAERLAQPDPGFSYTQWEAYLAIYHGRQVFIYCAADLELTEPTCPRDTRFVHDPAQERSQLEHYRRICNLGRDRGRFVNPERLSSAVLRDLVEILPRLESRVSVSPTRLRHTAEVLIGRDADLTLLDDAWNDSRKNVVVVRGKGGEGKTSLVASWMAELAMKGWRGAERVYDWTFYSQGTKDQSAASADAFVHAALADFGDPDPNRGGLAERGARLAGIVGSKRCLLVLDGLEPLQHPPGPMHGRLKDPGMDALLSGLAAQNAGLCVVTTREKVDEIQQHYGKSAVDHPLDVLTPLAGAALLHHAGARRAGEKAIGRSDEELIQASVELRGHALTLFLVGRYLKLAEHGDIRRRDCMKLAEADAEYKNDATRPYGHAFKALEAYEAWFAAGDAAAQRQSVILRLLGLFDRPASKGCLEALRAGEAIPGLTDALADCSEKEWRIAQGRLQEIDLIVAGHDGSIDGHPLLREYFSLRLQKDQPGAWRAAHSRLFDYLCRSTEHRPDTLEGLQPLYQAVTHGCLAGRHQEAREKVYRDRILRGTGPDGFYSMRKLGAMGADLGVVAAFFEEPWSRVSPKLSAKDQAWLLNEAATRLLALGRLTEAVEPMRVSGEMDVTAKLWKGAAISYSNLSELEVALGRLGEAVADGGRAIELADRSGDASQRISKRATAADALHQAGEKAEARALFVEAERMQSEDQSRFPLLYSLWGFRYADLLLAPAEPAAWAKAAAAPAMDACAEAERRANESQRAWRELFSNQPSLFDIALDHLTIARAKLYRALLEPFADAAAVAATRAAVETALGKLREANTLHHLPRALLTAAHSAGALTSHPDAARRYLDEAERIAERGPMPLYLADVHLHRARLFRDRAALAAARRLIEAHGYWRRREELEDAEAAAAHWPA